MHGLGTVIVNVLKAPMCNKQIAHASGNHLCRHILQHHLNNAFTKLERKKKQRGIDFRPGFGWPVIQHDISYLHAL